MPVWLTEFSCGDGAQNKPMKDHPLNRKMYRIHSKCSDYVIEYETKLRLEGKYEEYEKNLLNLNKNISVNDAEQMFEDFINNPYTSYVTEDGEHVHHGVLANIISL
jgi:hypothetical protein